MQWRPECKSVTSSRGHLGIVYARVTCGSLRPCNPLTSGNTWTHIRGCSLKHCWCEWNIGSSLRLCPWGMMDAVWYYLAMWSQLHQSTYNKYHQWHLALGVALLNCICACGCAWTPAGEGPKQLHQTADDDHRRGVRVQGAEDRLSHPGFDIVWLLYVCFLCRLSATAAYKKTLVWLHHVVQAALHT